MKKLRIFLLGTLRGRLILSVAIVHAVIMLFFILDLTIRQRAMLFERQEEEAIALTQTLSTTAAEWLATNNISGLQELIDAQTRYPELIFAILADNEGNILAHTDKSRKGQFLTDLPSEKKINFIGKTPDLVDIAAPVMLGDIHVGWVRIGIGQKNAAGELTKVINHGLLYSLAAIIIGSIIAWFMGRNITSRLYVVQDTINQISSGNYNARTQITGTDEAALLAGEFNAMLDTLAERKAELDESELRFRKLFNLAPLPMAMSDNTGKLNDFNENFIETFGYHSNELPDIETWWQLAYPDPEYRKAVINSWENDKKLAKDRNSIIKAREYQVCDKKGEMHTMLISGTIINNEILATFYDITERKRAEEDLRESQLVIEGILNAVPVRVFWKDRNLNFLGCNTAFAQDAGFEKPLDIIGKNDYQMGWHEQADLYRNDDNQVIETGTSKLNIEEPQTTPNGDIITLLTCKTPLRNANGEINGLIGSYFDITSIKKAEAKIKEQSLLLEKIFDNTPDCIVLLDKDYNFISVSESYARVCNKPASEFRGLNHFELYPSTLKEEFDEAISNNILYTKNARPFTFPDYPEKGVTYWDLGMVPIKGTDNQVEIILFTLKDVTWSKKAADELNESNEFKKSLLQTIPFGMHIIDENGNLLFQSESLQQIFEEKMSDHPCWELYHDDKEQCIQCPLRNEIEIGKTSSIESTKSLGGKVFEIYYTGMMFMGKKALLEIFIDITDRKQIENKLVETYERLTTLIEAIPDAIFFKDGEGRWLITNEPAKELFKLHHFDWFEKTDAQLGYERPELKEAHDACIIGDELAWNAAELIKVPEVIEDEQGKIHYYEVTKKPLFDDAGQRRGLVIIGADISQRKIAEQELIVAKDKAEESDRLKSAFLANISHEIRTPMNGILGFAELLKEPGLSGEEQQAYIRVIEKSGSRMLNTINQIVDISKIVAGQVEVVVSNLNVNQRIKEICAGFETDAIEKGLKIKLDSSLEKETIILKTDPEKLTAIFTNILQNAIKYTYSGYIEVGYQKNENDLEFFVKDTGIGISKERQTAIFERFVQADIEDRKALQGAGLGLAISKAYVEMLGGKIWVVSDPESGSETTGSTFHINLPLNNESKRVTENQYTSIKDGNEIMIKPLKILIAEDEESSGILIEMMVKNFSNEIIKVTTGAEAVTVCRENPDIDLVLMDIKLPNLNGYEATRRIRQFNTKVIIIAQTAFALLGDREKAITAGCNNYITKPIKKANLIQLLQIYFKL
ncbi:MAG: PAS domain S-box protein [Bacteroidales bacterium]|nr:PAS domain S-box protein [Bacteroidales bacterium]